MNLNVNPVDKRTALIYIDSNGNWHRASKGALEQIMNLCNLREDAKRNIHVIIDKVAEKGPRSLAVTTTPNSTSTFQPTSSNQCSIFHCSKKNKINSKAVRIQKFPIWHPDKRIGEGVVQITFPSPMIKEGTPILSIQKRF